MNKYIKDIISNIITDLVRGAIFLIPSSFLVLVFIKFKIFLLTPALIKPVFLVLLILIIIILIISIISLYFKTRTKHDRYVIESNGTFYNESEPSPLTEKTHWHFKNFTKYYYIPLLSYYGSSDIRFVDFCGPFCSNCSHLVYPNQSSLIFGPEFKCINCSRSYKIPRELLGGYRDKLFSYFKREYEKGVLRQSKS